MERTRNIVWALLLFCTFAVQAQIVPQRQDTARVIVTDTALVIQSDSVTITTDSVAPATPLQTDVIRQRADSVLIATSSDAFFAPSSTFKPSPRKAVLYSAIFPGLGQVYNRKYWKLPILYGGFAAFTYAVTWNNRYYQTYFEWHRSLIDGDPATNEWHEGLPYGQTAENVDQKWLEGVYNDRKDLYRYYRDFSFIGAIALYLLGIVDAYVDAQLFDFDISPDLSMRVQPTLIREDGQPNYLGNSYGFQWSVSF